MSVFFCPNAPRALARATARKATTIQPNVAGMFTCLGAARWFSGNASSPRPERFSCPRQHLLSKIRVAMNDPSHRGGSRRTFFSPAVIRTYEELPRDYRDQVGLTFSKKPLSEAEVRKVFGPGLGVDDANQLLRILHGRRVAGTVDDPAFYTHTARFTPEHMEHGLEYLRKTVVIDEVLNAGLRAEDELNELERQEERRRKSHAARQRSATEPVAEEAEEEDEVVVKEDSVYGRSKFDEIRARNVARQKAKDREREEAKAAAEAAEAAEEPAGPLAVVAGKERRLSNPKVAKYYEEATSPLKEAPQMTPWERIMPSATAVCLFMGFIAALALVYQDPAERYRLVPQISTSHATVGTLIGLQVLALLAWKFPPFWAAMNRYMVLTIGLPRSPALFGSIFSHQTATHLLSNAVPLWFIGTSLHDEMSRLDFLALFLGCGMFGYLGSLTTYTLRGMLNSTTLGSSGAVLGVCSAYFWEHRMDGFSFFGMPEKGVHGIIGLAVIVSSQLATYGKTSRWKVDLASHVCGIVAGLVGIEMINRAGRNRDLEQQKRTREARRKRRAELEGVQQSARDTEDELRRAINCTEGWFTGKGGEESQRAGASSGSVPGRR